ncbi:MAG: HAD family hydrolase, partial [Gemmatimonadota bacterium]|nr:HAD family hydrolase [Gemmatimonadota bacterium]
VLEELRRRGYRLGVISNSEDGQAERLVRLVGLLPFFDFCLDSYVFGSAKPDPAIFLHAVEQLGTAPGETVYVGDMFMQDVQGSQGAGLRAVLLDPFGLHPDAGVTRVRSLRELPELLGGG